MVDVRPLLAHERSYLLQMLRSLRPDEWAAPSPCPAWSVHELAVHLIHDDLRRLSAQRDGHAQAWLDDPSLDEIAVALDKANAQWVATMAPTLSPRLTCDMLAWLARPSEEHLTSLDPDADGATVSWAGPGPHPNWLDVGREFTERWVHHQQIRQAVDYPGPVQLDHLEAVVDVFARALPACLPPRPPGTEVQLRVSAPFQRSWTVSAGPSGWRLAEPSSRRPAALVEMPAQSFWRRAVRMLSREQAIRDARVEGDAELAAALLDLRAAIVRDVDPP